MDEQKKEEKSDWKKGSKESEKKEEDDFDPFAEELNAGAQTETVMADANANTMQDCLEIDGILDAVVCKNLFLCNSKKDRLYLVLFFLHF